MSTFPNELFILLQHADDSTSKWMVQMT